MNGLTNWKTTLAGMLGAAVIALPPVLQGGHPSWQQVAAAALCAAGGWVAKDSNVTGGTTQNAKT
jgi:uncharacterized membrane protein